MKKALLAVAMAGSVTLGGCASTYGERDETLEGAGTGAAIGAVAGAIWADSNNDGYADGYVREGQYYQGRPAPEAYAPPAPVYQAPPPQPVRRRSGERG
jgi:hypothetical protein